MNRRLRFLLVATVCQAVLGLAAVAVDTSREADTPQNISPNGALRGIAVENYGQPVDPSPGVDTTVVEATRVPGSSPTTGRPGARGVFGATTTTTRSAGATTTSRSIGTGTTTTGPSGPKCPNAKTCDIYKILDETSGGPYGGTKGWRPGADGIVRIPFYVKPTPPAGSGLTEDTMETAIRAGTRIIEAANPRIRFEYQGRTPPERVPQQIDGFNDFQWGDRATNVFDSAGYIIEADIRPTAGFGAGSWAYTPCEQRDDACGPSGGKKGEIMVLAVHESMHVLGLADLPPNPETAELTMNSVTKADDRHHVTLGLGDVLGLRALYPTSAPMPPIFAP